MSTDEVVNVAGNFPVAADATITEVDASERYGGVVKIKGVGQRLRPTQGSDLARHAMACSASSIDAGALDAPTKQRRDDNLLTMSPSFVTHVWEQAL